MNLKIENLQLATHQCRVLPKLYIFGVVVVLVDASEVFRIELFEALLFCLLLLFCKSDDCLRRNSVAYKMCLCACACAIE